MNKLTLVQVPDTLATKEYVDDAIGNIPVSESLVVDVSNMFDIDTDADVSAFLFKRDNEVDKGLIKLHGFDNSLLTDDLTITPVLGFGPQYTSYQTVRQTINGITFTDYAIAITKEYVDETGSIFIPFGVQTFDVNYYLHNGENERKVSYYITTDNIMYPFTQANTPIANFCSSASGSNSIIIEGNSVIKNTIKEIVFGEDYLVETTIGDYFLAYISSATKTDLFGLKNIVTIGNYFMTGCVNTLDFSLDNLIGVQSIGRYFLSMIDLGASPIIDTSKMTSLQTIAEYSFHNFQGGTSNTAIINISGFSSVTSILGGFMYTSTAQSPGKINYIQLGNVDWSNKTVTTTNLMYNIRNTTSQILYADSQAVADAFKAKMNGMISNWTVVIN